MRVHAWWIAASVLVGPAGVAHAASPHPGLTFASVVEGDASDAGDCIGLLGAVRLPIGPVFALVPTGVVGWGRSTDYTEARHDTLSAWDLGVLAQLTFAPRHTVSPFVQAGLGTRRLHRRYNYQAGDPLVAYADTRRRETYVMAGLGVDVRVNGPWRVSGWVGGAVGGQSTTGRSEVPGVATYDLGGDGDFVAFGRAALGVTYRRD